MEQNKITSSEIAGLNSTIKERQKLELKTINLSIDFVQRLISSTKPFQLLKTEDYHEDYGDCLFVRFSTEEDGSIIGESPEVVFASGYIQDGFDEKEWPYFVKGCWNFMFTDADPVNFPEIKRFETGHVVGISRKTDTYKMSVEEELEHVKNQLKNSQLELKNVCSSNTDLRERATKAESALNPTKKALEQLTSEKSRWLKKEARSKNR